MGQFVFAAAGTPQESQVKHDDVFLMKIDAVENRPKVVKRVVVADHHQYISGPNTEPLGPEIIAGFKIELIELRMFGRSLSSRSFCYRKDREEHDRETHAGDRGDLLGQQIDDTQANEGKCY